GRLLAELAEETDQAEPSLANRRRPSFTVAEGHDAEPVAPPRRNVAERERDALRDVGLPPLGCAELHRRRRVEDEPRDEHALGLLDAHVRLGRPRGDVPVDLPDVVARDVRPDLRELAA